MLPSTILIFTLSSLPSSAHARVRAEPAFQKLNPRTIYQGGWALALQGSASTTCPSDAPVLCPSTILTPGCCPTGQTCINGAAADANYCCPTTADCNTAVFNFPQCANTTWTMLKDMLGGYFCCEPGLIGVNSQGAGINGPLCEPADQVIPATLLATIYPQVTANAISSSTIPVNTSIAGYPHQTNPIASSTSTPDSTNNANNPISNLTTLSTAQKVGLVIAALATLIFILSACTFLNRRRARRNLIKGYRGYGSDHQYDEFSGYGGGAGASLPGYESYRRTTRTPVNENNVTVHVVSGDQTR